MRSLREAMAVDILSRYDRLGEDGRMCCYLHSTTPKTSDFTVWPDGDKVTVAQQLLQAAEELFYIDRDGACGAGLLSLYA
jgi:hypothetical protein